MNGIFYKIKSVVTDFFADIRFYPGGIILFGDSSYEIKGPHMREVLNNLSPGDILLRRYSHYVGSVVIPGHFSHAGLYIGNDEVIHMLGKGIAKEDILTFMRCDDMAIVRVRDESLVAPAIDQAKEWYSKEIEYDYNFETSKERFYCTELVDVCYGNLIRSKMGNKEIIMPDAFLDKEFFNLVWRK